MKFQSQKKDFLSKPDKSGIGGIDEDIKKLITLINKSQDYYTTSSCAGRIVLMKETGKKQENVFIFVTHKKGSFGQLKTALKLDPRANDMIYLKEEPCILHIACKNSEMAEKLVKAARQCGWKKSGIISLKENKVMVELLSTERVETPVSNKGKVLIPDDYLEILVKECNRKLSLTRQKIKKLEKSFR